MYNRRWPESRKGGILRYGDMLGAFVLLASMSGVAAAQATVKSESLPVFSRMDSTSDVVKTLKKGDAVVIEMSIQGEDGARWCSIRETAQSKSLGYVRCQFLDRPPEPKAPAPSAPSVPAQPAAQTPSDDFWNRVERQQVTYGEMRWLGETTIMARLSGFSPQQKARVLLLSRQAGIPSCIEDTDSYMRKGQMPPDALSSAPVTQCDWNWQAFMEQVLALVTPEQQAAHPVSYAEWRRQITGRRQGLERRSREP